MAKHSGKGYKDKVVVTSIYRYARLAGWSLPITNSSKMILLVFAHAVGEKAAAFSGEYTVIDTWTIFNNKRFGLVKGKISGFYAPERLGQYSLCVPPAQLEAAFSFTMSPQRNKQIANKRNLRWAAETYSSRSNSTFTKRCCMV